jgi:hypothetical protein
MPNEEELRSEIERLRAENESLKKKPLRGQVSMKVSEKGGLSVYGLGRFPVTLYREHGKSFSEWRTKSESSLLTMTKP